MKSIDLKRSWINFFVKNGHLEIPPASLIPKDDDSILWINSGVATLKDYFNGLKKSPNTSLVNYQKSIRTNDIDLVGITARHHTLFEMLGNFSIGGYFKEGAIIFALDYLLNYLKLDKEKLYITYFKEDNEARSIWLKNGVKESHLIPGDKKTNFWDIGAGPCGPNTEIFYDRGEAYDVDNIGIDLLINDLENDRYIEIWNIVFSQFNNDGKGNYTNLKTNNIDTGAGFERLLSILQNVPTNYDTDLFTPIMDKIEKLSMKKYVINNYFIKDLDQTMINKDFKIIADHIRTATLAINDGASPSNTGRGYIIRRLIRRAYRTGIHLGIKKEAFLYEIVNAVSITLPEYKVNIEKVAKIIKAEELIFAKTIYLGEKLFYKSLKDKNFNENTVFKLFETFGFPIELTKELSKENNITFDEAKVEELFKDHQNKSKSIVNKGMNLKFIELEGVSKNFTNFIGYDKENGDSEILFLFDDLVNTDKLNGTGFIIAKNTPFYATKGGQSHDIGFITQNGNKAEVKDVFLDKFGNHIHLVETNGEFVKGNAYFEVDSKIRERLEHNHSATHLLYSALINSLGIGVFQLGSDNNEDRLKFDYPADHLLKGKEILDLENYVNELIKQSIDREYIITTYKDAKKMGALGLPKILIRGEVRVVKFGNVSLELCGGTHVKNTREIEKFLIIKNESKGSGVYRIEALTSNVAIKKYFDNKYSYILDKFNGLLKKIEKIDPKYQCEIIINKISSNEELYNEEKKINDIFKIYKKINKKNNKVHQINKDIIPIIIQNKKVFLDTTFINLDSLRSTAINIRKNNPDAIIIFGIKEDKQLTLIVTSDKYDSNGILSKILDSNKGNGGGNSNFAQGRCLYNNDFEKQVKSIISEI